MFGKLLLAIDGSDRSLTAMPHVIELARRNGAAVVVVRAVEIVTEGDAIAAPERRAEAEASTREVVARLSEAGVASVVAHVVDGKAATVLEEVAEQEGVDLIVLTSHGRSGVARMVLGSVADQVVRSATCPVLLVRGAAHS